jgi:hypothetical protein
MTSRALTSLAALLALAATACTDAPTTPAATARIVALVPTGGATGVDPTAPIVMTFSGPMRVGMEQYVALHEGAPDGPVVPMSCTWSADRTTLACAPQAPLAAATRYTLHLGGGMRDQVCAVLDYDQCIAQHDGQWATGAMMGYGPGPRMGGGMMGDSTMMAPEWRHANGTYGTVFTFTTA